MFAKKSNTLQKTLEGCKKNHRDAQEKLYRQFYDLAYSICRKYMDNQHTIEELINDSFLKVFKGIINLKSLYAFTPWFKLIVRNTCISHLRSLKKQYNSEEFAEEEGLLQLIPDTSAADLKEALSYLQGDEKKAFELYSIDGYSHQEISKAMDIPVGTSKWLLHNARKKLASIYKTG